jgi:hypothetical protein
LWDYVFQGTAVPIAYSVRAYRRSAAAVNTGVNYMKTPAQITTIQQDVVLVGAGIMSATLAVFLKELQPELKIVIFERLESAAQDSSPAWNNAALAMRRCVS